MLIPKPTRPKAMDSADAEALALRALAWIVADDDRLQRFIGLTGMDLEMLRSRASDPAMLGGVLDCLLGDERWVTAFAAAIGVPPIAAATARRLLPGGRDPAP